MLFYYFAGLACISLSYKQACILAMDPWRRHLYILVGPMWLNNIKSSWFHRLAPQAETSTWMSTAFWATVTSATSCGTLSSLPWGRWEKILYRQKRPRWEHGNTNKKAHFKYLPSINMQTSGWSERNRANRMIFSTCVVSCGARRVSPTGGSCLDCAPPSLFATLRSRAMTSRASPRPFTTSGCTSCVTSTW